MGVLVEGEWVVKGQDADDSGRFKREPTQFHDRVRDDADARFRPEAGRYHLYVSLACPWAHRTLILRKLRGLEDVVSISVVDPYMGDEGWFFSDAPGTIRDTVNGAEYLREIYLKAKPDYTGRVTVPILWDKQTQTVVNNESREIIRMFDTAFARLGRSDVNLFPAEYRDAIDEAIDAIYEPVNNGVYRAGFALNQDAYEEAVTELFEALDRWDDLLSRQRYVCGPVLTEADVCLFTTLFRFDPVYHTHFKCNLKRIVDYPNLWRFTREIYQLPGVAETCDLDHIKQHYYRSHPSINPKGIVPKGPAGYLEGLGR